MRGEEGEGGVALGMRHGRLPDLSYRRHAVYYVLEALRSRNSTRSYAPSSCTVVWRSGAHHVISAQPSSAKAHLKLKVKAALLTLYNEKDYDAALSMRVTGETHLQLTP